MNINLVMREIMSSSDRWAILAFQQALYSFFVRGELPLFSFAHVFFHWLLGGGSVAEWFRALVL